MSQSLRVSSSQRTPRPCRHCGTEFVGFNAAKFCSLKCHFWASVQKGSGCWEWQGHKDRKGYGVLTRGKRPISVHRISYEIHNGPIPDGLLVCHTCDRPSCVRPDHLWLGTDADNAADKIKKGRHNALQGSDHPFAKFTEEDILAIRRRVKNGETQTGVALSYNVAPAYISQIVNRKIWKHVP